MTDVNAVGASSWDTSQRHLKLEHDSAQQQADVYREAAKDQVRLKTGLAVGLIPLNAAALFHAVTVRNDHSDFVPAVGFASAAALGAGGLLSSPAREAIYLQAQTATLCAMSAYDVYFIEKADYDTYLSDDDPLKIAPAAPQMPTGLIADISEVAKAQTALKTAMTDFDAVAQDAISQAQAEESAVAAKAKAVADAKAKATAAQKAKEAAAAHPAAPPAAPAAHPAAAPAAPAAHPAAAPAAPAAHPAAAPAAPAAHPAAAPAAPAAHPAAAPAAPAAHPAAAPAAAAANAPVAPTKSQKLTTSRTNLLDPATALVNSATSDVTAATATETSLQGFRERVDEAGRILGDRRMAIKTQVDMNIQTTELTIDQIKTAISASALASTQAGASQPKTSTSTTAAAQGAPDPAADPTFKASANDMQTKMKTLQGALDKLHADKLARDFWLQRQLQKESDATQSASCQASFQAILTATPPNPAEVAKGKPMQVKIHAPSSGGAPTATKVEDGLTAVMTTPGSYDYVLTISEASTPGSKAQTVTVSSGSQSVKVPFSVTDATDAGSGGDKGADAAATAGETVKATDKAAPRAPVAGAGAG